MVQLHELEKTTMGYYRRHGRHDLPWRLDTSPYAVYVSEVMLQQTQVRRVQSKFIEFTHVLPSFEALNESSQAGALKLWQGLGYNRRALWLKRGAEVVVNDFGGELPQSKQELMSLPGIGPNTAGSIAAFAFNKPEVFIETNIRRVFLHHCFADAFGVDDKLVLPLVKRSLAGKQPREWYWALMDYGSYLASQVPNPNRRSKQYGKQSRFSGSDRQIRGEMLKLLLSGAESKQSLLAKLTHLSTDSQRIEAILNQLVLEGFIERTKNNYKVR